MHEEAEDNTGKPCKVYEARICPGHENCDYRFCELQLKELRDKVTQSLGICREIIARIEAKDKELAEKHILQTELDKTLDDCEEQMDKIKGS